jgi:tRNA (guanosine-2'-O-)-methyltransferase
MNNEALLVYLENFISENRQKRFLEILQNRTKHFTVVVEDVFQMHNTSAVMRSCEVFGIQEINVIEQRYSRVIDSQIALGAEKWVDVNQFANSETCMESLRNQGYQIIATTPHNESCLLHEFDISKPSALFFGTEKEGLSEAVMQQADGFLKIPMVGFTESLNISVSASIILQDITNRLRLSSVDWQLSQKEIFEKRLDWTRKTIKDIENVEQRFHEL